MTIEKVKELKLQLEAAEKEMKVAYEKEQKVQAELWGNIISDPESYDWYITPDEMPDYRSNVIRSNVILHGVSIRRKIKDVIFHSWKNNGHTSLYPSNEICGMFYFRTNENILTFRGGGVLVLNTPMLCSDEEWKNILEGNIPRKYIKLP